jgi:transposase
VGKAALKSLSKNDLVRLILKLQERVEELEREISRLRKDSSTSSKPPSSDIVKPPKAKPPSRQKRNIGGQPGHERHTRKRFSPDEIDLTVIYEPPACPDCGGALCASPHPPRVQEQVEIVKRPVRVTRHEAPWMECSCCGTLVQSGLPTEVVKAGLVGPRLTAIVAYLKCVCHASFSTVRRFLRSVLGIRICRAQLVKLIGKAGDALEPAYVELLRALPAQPYLNVDETGHKENGKRLWTWCFGAPGFTVFWIDVSRGSEVLKRILGEAFGGVLGADYFSAYRKYMKDCDVRIQFCMAHLIRDVKYLTTLTDKVTRNYGQRVLDGLARLFGVLHRRGEMTEHGFERTIAAAREDLVRTAKRAPQRTEAQNLAARFRNHEESYFRFLTDPGVEPTNNYAEQQIRHVVIDRKITQGTRGENGRRWSQRIWSVVATCATRGREVLPFLEASLRAHFGGDTPPSLLELRSP